LSIGKNTTIVALKSIHQQLLPNCMKNVFLLSFWWKDAVKGKCMLFEIKAGNGGKLSQNQKDFIELARQKGIDVHIISDLQQAIQITEKG